MPTQNEKISLRRYFYRFCNMTTGMLCLFTLIAVDIYTHCQVIADIAELKSEKQHEPSLMSKIASTPPLAMLLHLTNAARSAKEGTAPTSKAKRKVNFLSISQLDRADGFSAAWMQKREDFLSMEFDKINIAIDAAFRAYDDRKRRRRMKMTLDWMDFAVEHMSKWWKVLEWDEDDPLPYQRIISHFERYLQDAVHYPMAEADPFLGDTIAVMPFFAYRCKDYPERGETLSALVLASTIESFRRAGFGRVIVNVMDTEKVKDDIKITLAAFNYIQDHVAPNTAHIVSTAVAANATQIGHMEVGFAVSPEEAAETTHSKRNFPKAALFGLRDAFILSQEDGQGQARDESSSISRTPMQQQQQQEYIQSWLGNKHDPSYWKYVYYTEPDSMLQTRPSATFGLKKKLDKGSILIPHRLQPIPHQSDVPGMDPKTNRFLLQEDFPTVIDLDREADACCDVMPDPGILRLNERKDLPCLFWWRCGFEYDNQNANKTTRHSLLESYQLMRISSGGTGVVTLAASEHSRKCLPKRNGICEPSLQSLSTSQTYNKRKAKEEKLKLKRERHGGGYEAG